MWQVTGDTWHITGGEHCVKLGSLALMVLDLLCFKDLEEKDHLMSPLITEVFVEQPRLHQVC